MCLITFTLCFILKVIVVTFNEFAYARYTRDINYETVLHECCQNTFEFYSFFFYKL